MPLLYEKKKVCLSLDKSLTGESDTIDLKLTCKWGTSLFSPLSLPPSNSPFLPLPSLLGTLLLQVFKPYPNPMEILGVEPENPGVGQPARGF